MVPGEGGAPATSPEQRQLDVQDGISALGGKGMHGGICVKNTFLEIAEEDDPWFISPTTLRQKTDSLLDRSSHSLQLEMGGRPSPMFPSLPSAGSQAIEEGAAKMDTSSLSLMAPDVASLPLAGPSMLGAVLGRNAQGRPRTLADLIPAERAMPSAAPVVRRSLSGSFNGGQIDEETMATAALVPPPGSTAALAAAAQQHWAAAAAAAAFGEDLQQPLKVNQDQEDDEDWTAGGEDTPGSPVKVAAWPSEEGACDDIPGGGARTSEMQTAREKAEKGEGLSGFTTVMLREIPAGYSQRKLMREINSMGFLGKFDFLYLPMDPRSKAGRGFAFVNFVCPEVAEQFYRKVHGERLRHFHSERDLAIVPADVQGFEANAAHFAALQGAKRKKRTPHSRPLFFRKLPPGYEGAGDEKDAGGGALPYAQQAPCMPYESAYEPTYEAFEQQVRPQAPPRRQQMGRNGGNGYTMTNPAVQSSGYEALPMPLQMSRPRPRFCGYCGAPTQDGFSFCPYCGGKLME